MSDQTADDRVPAPEMPVHEQIVRDMPTDVAKAQEMQRLRQQQFPGVPVHFLGDHPFGEVVGAIANVMAEIQPVEKGGKNTFHDYKYARMQDILQVLTPLMGKHGIVVFQYEATRNMFDNDKVMAITYNFVVAHKSGQYWLQPVPQTGMSPCRTSKNTFDDKAFAKCHTSARKYFLLSLFQVPTEDENDPDNERRQRGSNAPVPSPDGHVAPHLIEPAQRDTFDSWADRYLAAARKSKTIAELDGWDIANDDPLTQMDANEKGKPVYERVLREFDAIRAKLQPTAEAKPDPISTGPQTQQKALETQQEPAPAQQTTAFVRPEGMPNAEMEPDAFMDWAKKRMDAIGDPQELNLIWEGEITPGSDGLFMPDCKELEAHYDARLAKIGG